MIKFGQDNENENDKAGVLLFEIHVFLQSDVCCHLVTDCRILSEFFRKINDLTAIIDYTLLLPKIAGIHWRMLVVAAEQWQMLENAGDCRRLPVFPESLTLHYQYDS